MKIKFYPIIAAAIFSLSISGTAIAQLNHGAKKADGSNNIISTNQTDLENSGSLPVIFG